MSAPHNPLQDLAAVWRRPDNGLTLNEQAILTVLIMSRDNKTGLLYRSHNTIAKETKLGRSTVIQTINSLIAKGWLERHKQPAPKATHYTVHVLDSPANGLSTTETMIVHQPDVDSPPAGHDLLKYLPNDLPTTVHSPAASDTTGVVDDVSRKQNDAALGKDANTVVERLSELRVEHGARAVASRHWGVAVRIAKAMLRDDTPHRDLLATLDWAFKDDYWRPRMIASGMKALSIAHANWLQRDKKKPARGKYQDTATEPKLSGVMLEVQ